MMECKYVDKDNKEWFGYLMDILPHPDGSVIYVIQGKETGKLYHVYDNVYIIKKGNK
jgi:hypothetical protein